MAYQPKSYRKFVAAAATATLVASAVTPAFAASFTDVGDRYKEAVDYLVAKNLTQGVSETQFGVDQQIKRVDFAVMVAKAVLTQEQIDNAKASGFTDVPDRGVKYVNALKEAGIANGKSDTRFGASDEITRGEAALMFAKAYKITGNTANIAFTDVSERYAAAVAALVDNKITSGKTPTKFGTTDPIKRGEFAIFLHKLETINDAPTGEIAKKITNVKAINDTKIELTFDGAFSADIADEIEKDPTRIVVFHGGQTANSDADTVIKSSFISFNAERTGASVILSDDVATVEAGIAYTVALMDGTDNEVADVVLKSEPTVLKAGADKPTVEVNKDQDKFVLNFKKKMSAEALDLSNYTLYDENDKELGELTDFADAAAEWVDATEKTAVEFKIAPGSLLAGKTYKVKVDVAVETDKGDALSSSQRTITVKTPSVSDAQPVAKVARIVDDSIIVTFDKDLDGEVNFNRSLITIKSPTGKTLTIGAGLTTAGNELTIPIDPTGIALDRDLTYTINLPANGVANEVFTNATNKEVTGLKAVAQKDVEVKSVKAELVRQSDEKTKADLLLTFDQRVNLASIVEDGVTIEESGKVYTLQPAADIEIYSGDTSGKTIKIKDVQAAFDNDFTPESGETYTVVIETGTVQTDAGADAKFNRVKLKASLTGVDVVAPKIDKVTVESAEKIVVKFDQNIDAKNLKASDITVQGFEKYRGGRFEELTLQGSTQLKFSASGDTLTITPADSSVKFQTGADADADKLGLVTIAANAIKGANGIVAESELELTKVSKFIDNAAPIIIGANTVPTDGLTVTYSEPVVFKGADAASAGSQYTVEGAERNSYGTTATVADNEVSVTFKDDVFKAGEDYSETKVFYKRNSTSAVKDTDGNEQANATLTGVSN